MSGAPSARSARGAAEPGEASGAGGGGRVLVIACGALAREILLVKEALGLAGLDLSCLPAAWHNRPERIVEGLRARIREGRAQGYGRIFAAYADCGTGGEIDRMLAEEGVRRLPGAHCYAFYTGVEAFMERIGEDARSFFLTDYLARHFDTLVMKGLMLDARPELIPAFFGNYERLVYLAQTDDETLTRKAREAAARLGLKFERRFTGPGDLERALAAL